MHGRLDTREINDIGDTALSFSEVKALATGNPLLMDKAEADATLTRLQRAERAHHRNQDNLRHTIAIHESDIKALTALATELDQAITRRRDTRGEAFTMTVADRIHRKRTDAGQHLKHVLDQEAANFGGQHTQPAPIGQLGGFPLVATFDRALGQTTFTLILDGVPGGRVRQSVDELITADLVARLEHRLHHLEERRQEALVKLDRAHREITHATETLGQPRRPADRIHPRRGRHPTGPPLLRPPARRRLNLAERRC